MSERAGSVRDARFLSGADLGRTITVYSPFGWHFTGSLHSIEHTPGKVTISIKRGPAESHLELRPHDAVTITGADA